MERVFYGFTFGSPIISEVTMEHSERVRRNYDETPLDPDEARKAKLRSVGTLPVLPPHVAADLRFVLDYLDGEYCGPDMIRALRRLRGAVGATA